MGILMKYVLASGKEDRSRVKAEVLKFMQENDYEE